MLKIKNLSINLRQPLFYDFTYNFLPSSIYGLIATNGKGKTSFFRAIMNLIPKESGSVCINEKDISASKQSIFYFESSNWFDLNVSGLDYLKLIKQEWNSSKDIQSMIDYWDMSDYIRLPIRKYSLGMKQKLLLSLYQISNADYLLFDEPTNALDEGARKKFFSLINQLREEEKTIILSSHYKEDILNICDFLLTIDNVRIEAMKV
ncbi:MAG: ATP-binding cassette domain-containing protein [Streptococcaceae bacterium]|jgi:ABC-2 type transport system ATP-binding protein|nr:ATP-binding cassette domain-containing protein [Streptococcaceae bacterium]